MRNKIWLASSKLFNNNHMESTETTFTTHSEKLRKSKGTAARLTAAFQRQKGIPFNKPAPGSNEENRKKCKLWHFKYSKTGQKELLEQLEKGIKWVMIHFFKHIRSRRSARVWSEEWWWRYKGRYREHNAITEKLNKIFASSVNCGKILGCSHAGVLCEEIDKCLWIWWDFS